MIIGNVLNIFLMFSFCNPFADAISDPLSATDPVDIYELVISEIMADPTPVIKLPEFEYIEIFNRSSHLISLTNITLCTGKYTSKFSSGNIAPGEFVIVCDDSCYSLFEKIGQTLSVKSMPPILNSGQTLTLRKDNGSVIHSVTFTDSWYKDPNASKGGRSLEMIDCNNPCGGKNNWSASLDPSGGTPGTKNSVASANPDHKAPGFLRAAVYSDTTAELYFDESLDPRFAASRGYYTLNNSMFEPRMAIPVAPDFTRVLLQYHTPFSKDLVYTVTVMDSVKDCAGNKLESSAFGDLAVPVKPEESDIIINEILFNVSGDNAEFIELYNRSDKIIDLAELHISFHPIGSDIKNVEPPGDNRFLLFPDKCVALTKNVESLHSRFPAGGITNLFELPGLFTLPDQEGLISLSDTGNQIIDEFWYEESMHHQLLNNYEDVSLERVNPDLPSSDLDNWESASSLSGFATPGRKNSQTPTKENFNITLSPEIISPDQDGIDDQGILHLQFDEPGWAGTVKVFNTNGKEIQSLANNVLLGQDEFLYWDGTMLNGDPAQIGIYVIYIELFNKKGIVKKFKKVITLVRR